MTDVPPSAPRKPLPKARLLAAVALALLALLYLAGRGSSPSPATGPAAASPAGAAAGGASDIVLTRDSTLAQKYSAPGPRRCSTATPPGDSLSDADAALYLTCGLESETGLGDGVYLASDVTAQLGQPRAYSAGNDDNDTSIDPTKPVYDLRGTAMQYVCVAPASFTATDVWKSQCRGGRSNNLQGICYKTTFGEWRCHAADGNNNLQGDPAVAVPSADV